MDGDCVGKIKKIIKILVIYTGGTIGMQRDDTNVFVPVRNAFIEKIKSFPQLHNQTLFNELVDLGVIDETNSLVIGNIRGRNVVNYKIEEYDPLLDSSNMSADDWIRIAKNINDCYDSYDGFVILHGTDTLIYTASALSFLLQNLQKPVIITGSQISIFETNTDAITNMLNSFIYTCHSNIKEVCVCFGNKLMRGNRTIKTSSARLDAFSSPNYRNLGQVGLHVEVENALLLQHNENSGTELRFCSKLERNVRELKLTPLMSLDMINECLSPPTKGVVLVSYGYGNIPMDMEGLPNALRHAVETNEVIIVIITQCIHGTIGNYYATSQELGGIGVIACYDMTTESALVKLSYVLGRNDWSLNEKKEAMRKALCGEMTIPE